nr:Gfo/Idh/MocA family oxidoreductase [Halocatena marina]
MSEHTIGIVGLGTIGRFHVEHLTTLATEHNITLAGGMDIAPPARDRFEEQFGAPAYGTYGALYEHADVAIITTPNRHHEAYAVGARDAGLDVLIEKPLAHTLESAEHIATVAQASELVCMVDFHNRFAHPVQVLMEYLREGRFGEVYHIEATYVRRRGMPGRGSWFTREPNQSKRSGVSRSSSRGLCRTLSHSHPA